MPSHHDQQQLPYTCEQLFDLVADVEKYPAFLPWCRAARIIERGDGFMVAELMIAFKGIRESYISRVDLHRASSIHVTMVKGPFQYLTNHWSFQPVNDQTLLDFSVDFKFSSRILDALIGALFSRATEKMVSAFRQRANDLYSSD
ncbi:MAG: type II toxin-antitoxin system RatA family toxin [Rickettsiales bacterium]|nr:type II toxin-antitoxin system RatA family toxin [Rickettsiales bacterium]